MNIPQKETVSNMETNQKIQLATKGKVVCPACGRRTFVNYVYSDGSPVADGVCGRCDRLDNCGYHCPPRQYFAETGTTFKTDIVKSIRPQRPKVEHPTFIDTKYVEMSLRCSATNPLKIFLHNIFDSLCGADVVNRVMAGYLVGTARRWGGATVFWQIDNCNNIRAGKIMGYDAESGKRLKNPNPLMTWVHSELKDRYPNFVLSQAFFGAHLTTDNQSVIWLFESEKSSLTVAIVLAWLCPGNHAFVPIASSGCGGLNPSAEKLSDRFDKHQALRGRRVVLFPDEGKFEEWRNRAELLRGWCSEVYISPIMETGLTPEQYQPQCPIDKGDDLADVILAYIRNGRATELATLMMNLYDIPGTNKYKLI